MKALRYAALGVLALLFISPLIFMVGTSFKSPSEATDTPPSLIPTSPTTQAYDRILNAADTPVFQWFLNSLMSATAHAALVVATSALAAYALARLEFRGKKIVFAVIVA